MEKYKAPIKELLNFAIINIDKPCGPTSFSVSDYVYKQLREFGVNKTSHFGTLDPKVTGVLPVAIGRACRLTGFFLGHDKEYIGIIHVHKEQDIAELQKIINDNFMGKIKQTPPIKSRVKRVEREREVKRFELLERNEESKKDFLFIAEVEGGTYIRKLCSDLGEIIGGAHMLELRRIRAGIFSENDSDHRSVSLYEFKEAVEEFRQSNGKKDEKLRKMLIPAGDAIKKIMGFVYVRNDMHVLKALLTGKPLFTKDIIGKFSVREGENFAVFVKNDNEQFIEIAKKTNDGVIAGKAQFVLA